MWLKRMMGDVKSPVAITISMIFMYNQIFTSRLTDKKLHILKHQAVPDKYESFLLLLADSAKRSTRVEHRRHHHSLSEL